MHTGTHAILNLPVKLIVLPGLGVVEEQVQEPVLVVSQSHPAKHGSQRNPP